MKKLIFILIILLALTLRLYKVNQNPPSLYWDEASLGYNAYSILKTAKDEHSKFLPLTNFAAFGDYKPPVYIYSSVPFIALLGPSEIAIRFPSVMAGVLSVMFTYLLVKKLYKNEILALTSSFFLAISPWHIQFSRAAFEANLALLFSLSGIYFFIKFVQDKNFYIIFSAASFLLAMYTFTGQRLFVPLILLVLAIQFRDKIISNLKYTIPSLIISLILFWPLFKFASQTIEGRLRFNEVTIFNDLKPIEDSIRFRERSNFAWWSNLIYNRRVFYTHEYLTHYFDAFNPSFLFSRGDGNPRLSIQEVGQLYYFDALLLIAGLYFMFRRNYKYKFLIIGWLLISPLGPATARETPHALRMVHILPTFQIISAIGLLSIFSLLEQKKIAKIASVTILAVAFFYYLHMYYVHYPLRYSGEWQYGYKQAVEAIESRYEDMDNIVVTTEYGRPYIYFLLFMNYDPEKYFQNSKVARDEFFFLEVEGFDKFHFTRNPESLELEGSTLYITAPGQLPGEAKKTKAISNLAGEEVFYIGESL